MRISDWSSDVCSSDLDIFVERQFGFLPNAGILGVARFAFLLIGLRFLRSRPLRLRQQRPVIGAWLRRSADGWRRKDPSHQSAIAKIACLARADRRDPRRHDNLRSEEHTSELQSLMRISYAVFCLKKKNK